MKTGSVKRAWRDVGVTIGIGLDSLFDLDFGDGISS